MYKVVNYAQGNIDPKTYAFWKIQMCFSRKILKTDLFIWGISGHKYKKARTVFDVHFLVYMPIYIKLCTVYARQIQRIRQYRRLLLYEKFFGQACF